MFRDEYGAMWISSKFDVLVVAVYVSNPTCGVAFAARWLVPGDPPGFYQVRDRGRYEKQAANVLGQALGCCPTAPCGAAINNRPSVAAAMSSHIWSDD